MRLTAPLLAILSLQPALAFASPPAKEIHKTLALDAAGEVSIKTHKGSVAVTTGDKAEVKIDARIESDGLCGDAAEQAKQVERTNVTILPSNSSIRIESDYSQLEHIWRAFTSECSSLPLIHYQITMPKTARLAIEDHKSQITVSNLSAKASIQSHKGTIKVSGLSGSLDLQTHKGHAQIAFAKLSGSSRFETHKGDIEVVLPGSAGFVLDAQLGRRAHLESDFASARREDRRGAQSYSGPVNGGGPELHFESHRGNLFLKKS
jgi:hypothetical protein